MSEVTMDDKADLGERLTLAAQRNATDAVMMHQAVADKLGLHVTDLRCLNLLRLGGPATPGELAARTGLTTGAVTRMIDRLLKGGFVRREHDEQDRRRVIITPTEDRVAEIGKLYEPLAREFGKALSDYTTEQLELILDLFNRLHETSQKVTVMLREDD
ncbi:MarR family winged helix-turn-helix transcriptional regulator [Nocardia transvalensis]|uniref:MarR family winged helix-turn-helix transcriptional regulator n=1 Tax=Nocardia transvalensis TaxID=37333 RepID=UPI00189310C2|nr:MarR family transcriptional regulator [Nocardia transvalensis]MBF6333410.1 MarR family transcriptional regulator [Nocardia transvalensis]